MASSSSSTSSSLHASAPLSSQPSNGARVSISPKCSRTYRIAVVGYCSSFSHSSTKSNAAANDYSSISAAAGGAGKSCMCQRIVHAGEDGYRPNDHTSVLNLADFAASPVINNEHFIYWGCAKRYADDGMRELCFEIIEHTEFVDDSTFQPHRSPKIESYIKRSTRLSLCSPGKLQYFSKNQLGIEQEYLQNLMLRESSTGVGEKLFNIDGFILCYDVSTARANITSSSFDGSASIPAFNHKISTFQALPASCAEQTDLALKLLQTIVKQKRPVIVVTTKNDELHRPLAREAEKLVGRKEFKGAIPLVETSAHRNVNITGAFMMLAQLIDRTSSSSSNLPLTRAVNYPEACRLMGEKCTAASNQFAKLLRAAVSTATTSTSYEAVKMRLEKEFDFTNFVELFGENFARRKIDQQLQAVRERQAQLRAQQQLQDFRTALPKIMPDVRVFTESKWLCWQDCIKSLPTYQLFFTAANSHHSRSSSSSTHSSSAAASPAATARFHQHSNTHANFVKSPTISIRNSAKQQHSSLSPSSSSTSQQLPESILYHLDAEQHFMAYVDVASVRQRHMMACESFMQLLRANSYVVPGRSLRDVLLHSYHSGKQSNGEAKLQYSFDDEQFADLGDDKKLELYAAHQRLLIERSKNELKDYLWENISVCLHVLLTMPQEAAKMLRKNYRQSKKPTNVDSNNNISPAHIALKHADATKTSLDPQQPTSWHTEIGMIDAILSNASDNKRYRAFDYLSAERERMLSQHVWLLRSSMPEVCPGPLTYCADLYTACVLDSIDTVMPLFDEEKVFCRQSSTEVDLQQNQHKLIVDDRSRLFTFSKRLDAVLGSNNQIDLEDGVHFVHVSRAVVTGDENSATNDEDACFVYVYEDYESVKSLFLQLCGRLPPPPPATTDSGPLTSSRSTNSFPSPSSPLKNSSRFVRRLALVVFYGSPAYGLDDEEDDTKTVIAPARKQEEFFNLFQLGMVLAEQLGCIFVQLASGACLTNTDVEDDDTEMVNQQLLTSLQSLLHEHSRRRYRHPQRPQRLQCSSGKQQNRQRNFSSSSSSLNNSRRRPSLASDTMPPFPSFDDSQSEYADLHIRLCFMCGDVQTTRHVLMCVLRYYFCSRINISSCVVDHSTAAHHKHNRNVSTNSSTLSMGGVVGSVHDDVDYYCGNNNKNFTPLVATNNHNNTNSYHVAPRSIAFNVYLPAPPPSSSSLSILTNNQQQNEPGSINAERQTATGAALADVNSIKSSSIFTLAGQSKKRCRIHLHFTSYHEVLRQICCNATATRFPSSSSFKKKTVKPKNSIETNSSLNHLNSYCSCGGSENQHSNNSHHIPDDGFILVYNAARPASFTMAHALGSQLAMQKSSSALSQPPPVMLLAISNAVEWSAVETDLIRNGIVLCEDLQGRWLTCSLLDPIPKIAFDNFWKSCWERRNDMLSYEAASTATVYSSLNSVVSSSGGCGYYYAAPATTRPSVSEQEEESAAVENPTYGTCDAAVMPTGEDDHDDNEDDDEDDDYDEVEEPLSAETVLPLSARRHSIKIEVFNEADDDEQPKFHTTTCEPSCASEESSSFARNLIAGDDDAEAVALKLLEVVHNGAGSRRPSRTEALRLKFEAENTSHQESPPPPAVKRRSAPANNKRPPQRPPPTVMHSEYDSKRFSTNFSGNALPLSSADIMSTSAYAEKPARKFSQQPIAAADQRDLPAANGFNNNSNNDDENDDNAPPPPLPGRLRNSSKYSEIMGHLNVNIQQTQQQKSRLVINNYNMTESENIFDLGPSKPGGSGGGGAGDAKSKKKKRKPIVAANFAAGAAYEIKQHDQADESKLSIPKKISLPFNVVPSASSSSKSRLSSSPFSNDYQSYNLSEAAAAAASSSRGRRSERLPLSQPAHHLLGADAAWHDDVEQQQKSPAVQLLSVKGLTPSNSRRGSRNEQPSLGLILPSGSSGKLLPNARFVLPPVSPRVVATDKDDDAVEAAAGSSATAPLSPVSVAGGSAASADKSKRGVGSLFGGGNDGRLRKSFDNKKRLAWKKDSSKANSADANSSAVLSAETFEELVTNSNSDKSVPKFIELCIEFIEKDDSVGGKAMELEGLYRIPGNRAQAVLTMNDFLSTCAAAGGSGKQHKKSVVEINNRYTFPADTAPPTVCTALKMYLNERTPPLLPKRLVDAMVRANFANLTSNAEKISVLKSSLNDRTNISLVNYAVLRYIAEHLHRVSRAAQQNCMTAKNLSICWWPTMCRLDVPDLFEFEKVRCILEDAVHVMIEEVRKVFVAD